MVVPLYEIRKDDVHDRDPYKMYIGIALSFLNLPEPVEQKFTVLHFLKFDKTRRDHGPRGQGSGAEPDPNHERAFGNSIEVLSYVEG
ncbi:hypothetical protein Tco_0921585 [Tanacetum coccineum]